MTDTITRIVRAETFGAACVYAKAQGLSPGSWTFLQTYPAPPEPDNGWQADAPAMQAVKATPTAFGTLLKQLRETAKVSQSKLAERAGFDRSYVSRLESGARMPTREAVDRLGAAMDLGRPDIDTMLSAAGFLPVDVSSLLSSEPVIGEVLDLLQDEGVPTEYRENLRQVLKLLTAQVRLATNGGSA